MLINDLVKINAFYSSDEACLYPAAVNDMEQLRVECINATNSTLELRWFPLNISDQCRDQLTAFPTIRYIISYRMISSMNVFTEVCDYH